MEKTELTSTDSQLRWAELKLGGVSDDEDDGADDDEDAQGGATLTNPVNRLSRGSAHRPPADTQEEDDVDDDEGSKVNLPL